MLEPLLQEYGFSLSSPWKDIDKEIKDIILYGSKKNIEFTKRSGTDALNFLKPFDGIVPMINQAIKQVKSRYKFRELFRYQSLQPCGDCNGKRLNENALCVKIDDIDISILTAMSIKDAKDWISNIADRLTDNKKTIATPIVKEIFDRLSFLNEVGLDYLTLARSSGTLSGGEAQRIRLASQIGSKLTGVIYVLDEPSIGLHQRDNGRLLHTLSSLRDLGNTVIIVEHDEEAMRAADYIVDIGPGAGVNGGDIVAKGSLKDIEKNNKSITGKYLSKKLVIDIPNVRRKKTATLRITDAKENNIKGIDADFPLGLLLCITGVSGSGKSTLINNILFQGLNSKLSRAGMVFDNYSKIVGDEYIDKIIEINQSPIGRTPRSNPVTYTGTFTPIRDWFASPQNQRPEVTSPVGFLSMLKVVDVKIMRAMDLLRLRCTFFPMCM